MPKINKRQIRWEARSEDNPPQHVYNFLIINENREIRRITQRLSELLKPATEPRTLVEGIVPATRLRYQLITLTSYQNASPDKIELRIVYKGRITRDRELYQRKSVDGLANHVEEQVMSGRFS